jgi:hypothetical protein
MKTDKKSIERVELVCQILKARKNGFTYEEISGQVQMEAAAVRKIVSRALKSVVIEDAKDLKIIQYLQIQDVLMPILEKAKKGNLLAVDRLVKLWKREAELMGLDAPTKIAPTDPDGKEKSFGQVVFYLPDNGRDEIPTEAKRIGGK